MHTFQAKFELFQFGTTFTLRPCSKLFFFLKDYCLDCANPVLNQKPAT